MINSFKDYNDAIGHTATYTEKGNNLVYPVLGLVGEAGEAAEKVKKIWRNHGLMCDPRLVDDTEIKGDYEAAFALREGLIKELSDVLWYLNAIANELGITLADVAQVNVDKLLDRAARGVIKSEGDNR